MGISEIFWYSLLFYLNPMCRYFFTIIIGSLCVALLSQKAHAQSSRLYFAGYLGLTSFPEQELSDGANNVNANISLDNATNFGAAMGLRLSPELRLEGEFSYRKGEINTIEALGNEFAASGEVKNYNIMANLYYDFDVDWPVQPFIGAGVGFGIFDVDIEDSTNIVASESGDDWGLAYQIGGGIKYRASEDVAFTGSYRYLGGTDLQFGQSDLTFSGHEFRVGIEYDIPTDAF